MKLDSIHLRPEISIDKDVLDGRPRIRGTRLTPSFIVGLLASGMSIKAILAEYDDLTRKDVLACLDFAAQAAEIVQSDMSNNRRKRR